MRNSHEPRDDCAPGTKGQARQGFAEALACLKTTLYDVKAAVQSDGEPAEDDLVVALMVRWLHTWCITLVRAATGVA
jgi:hypothetical protein